MFDITTDEEFSQTKAIFFAAKCGRIDTIHFFLKNGFDINSQDEKGDTLLHFAVRTRNTVLINYLLEHGAKIILNKKNRSPLLDAYADNQTEIVKNITNFVNQKNSVNNITLVKNSNKIDTQEQEKLRLLVNAFIKQLKKNYLNRNIFMRLSAKHNDRATALIIAAQRCRSVKEFKELLDNQLNLFNSTPKQAFPKELIAERWSKVIKNKPNYLNKSQFYKILNIFDNEKFGNNLKDVCARNARYR